MLTLFLRTVIVYATVAAVLRLMGKRQISDMQPFDLVVTLLIADAASSPLSDVSVPLMSGAIPVLALFILHRAVSFISLRSRSVRRLVCGSPVVVIRDGVILEDAMRAASLTLCDLTEQLRAKDVFSFTEVAYGILETNGSLSVLKSSPGGSETPASLLVSDGKLEQEELSASGVAEKALRRRLKVLGADPADCLYASLESDGTLLVQTKSRGRSKPRILKEGRNES